MRLGIVLPWVVHDKLDTMITRLAVFRSWYGVHVFGLMLLMAPVATAEPPPPLSECFIEPLTQLETLTIEAALKQKTTIVDESGIERSAMPIEILATIRGCPLSRSVTDKDGRTVVCQIAPLGKEYCWQSDTPTKNVGSKTGKAGSQPSRVR